MANIAENPTWAEGVYQLETSDPVLGGPGGISNQQAKDLADRTAYLKEQIEGHLDMGNVDAGTLDVEFGGTGRSDLTTGHYLVGAGTDEVELKTPSEVLADIKAIPYYTSAPTTNGAPVIYVTGQGFMVWAGAAYAVLEAAETVKGMIEIATTVQAQALTDDTVALTPKKLLDVMGNSYIGSDGYVRIPVFHTGAMGLRYFIIQWGSVNVPLGGLTVTFPVTFPGTSNPRVVANHISGGSDPATPVWVNAVTAANVTLDHGESSRAVNYIAVGY